MMKYLLETLEIESMDGKTRIDSSIYREVLNCGNQIVRILAESLTTTSVRHYLSLEALRKLSPRTYSKVREDIRLEIYTDAMRHAIVFNDWGLPSHGLKGETTHAMIESGQKAIPFLKALLSERRLAPCLGSETATLSKDYDNRICDYALVMVQVILNESGDYPYNVELRDVLIAQLQHRLSAMDIPSVNPKEKRNEDKDATL